MPFKFQSKVRPGEGPAPFSRPAVVGPLGPILLRRRGTGRALVFLHKPFATYPVASAARVHYLRSTCRLLRARFMACNRVAFLLANRLDGTGNEMA